MFGFIRAIKSDRGSGSVLALGIIATLLTLALVGLAFLGLQLQLSTLQNKVNQAALVGSDTARGLNAGYPCQEAEKLMRLLADSAQYSHWQCLREAEFVTVSVQSSIYGLSFKIQAKAGPPAK